LATDNGIAPCAALAARKGVELHDLIMGMPKLLEWLGRMFISRDGLLGEGSIAVRTRQINTHRVDI